MGRSRLAAVMRMLHAHAPRVRLGEARPLPRMHLTRPASETQASIPQWMPAVEMYLDDLTN